MVDFVVNDKDVEPVAETQHLLHQAGSTALGKTARWSVASLLTWLKAAPQSLLDKTTGDGLYSPLGHDHDTEYAPLDHVGAVNTAHGLAAGPSTDGFMTGEDKVKLDGVAAGATNNTGALADLDTVGTNEIDDLAVTTAKLGNNAVTTAKIERNANVGFVLTAKGTGANPAWEAQTGGGEGIGEAPGGGASYVRQGSTASWLEGYTKAAADLAFAPIAHVGAGTTSAHPDAISGGNSGFMTGADKAKLDGLGAAAPVYWEYAIGPEGEELSTGVKLTVRAPYALTITEIRLSLAVADSASAFTVDTTVGGTSVHQSGTLPSITSTNKTSLGDSHTINNSGVLNDAEIVFNITVTGTVCRGPKVKIYGTPA